MKTFATFALLGLALGFEDNHSLNSLTNHQHIDNLHNLKLQDIFDSFESTGKTELVQNIDKTEVSPSSKFLGKMKETKEHEVKDFLAETVEEFPFNSHFFAQGGFESFVKDVINALKKKLNRAF